MKGVGVLHNNKPIQISGGIQFGSQIFNKNSGTWTKFEGELADNEWEGLGKLHLTNKDMYYGEFKKSRLHGHGCLYTNNGEIISGLWENSHFIKSGI